MRLYTTLHDAAAQRYLQEAAQRMEAAHTKTDQMGMAPVDWQLVLLHESNILSTEAAYLDALAQKMLEKAASMRAPLSD